MIETDELVKSQFIEMFGDPETNPKGLKMTTIGMYVISRRKSASRSEFILNRERLYSLDSDS
jgi:hypothetical protein